MACPDITSFLQELRSIELEPFGKKLHKINNFGKKVSNYISSQPSPKDAAASYINGIDTSGSGEDFYSRKIKLELANILHHPDHIIEVFKSGDKLLLHRALQFNWIFQDPSSPLHDKKFLLEELLPKVSYSCRKKLIKRLGKLSKDGENDLDELYKSLEQHYGVDLVRNLLSSCSSSLVKSTLENKPQLHLTSYQMASLYKKDPQLAVNQLATIYGLKNHHTCPILHGNNRSYFTHKDPYLTVLSLFAKNKPAEFFNFYTKYYKAIADLRIGKRLTSHLLRTNDDKNQVRQEIIKKSHIYSTLLHQPEVMKQLDKTEYFQFFCNLFPKGLRHFKIGFEIGMEGPRGISRAIHTWLKNFPQAERFDKLNAAFQHNYSKSILDLSDLMTARIIQLLPPGQVRDHWVDQRLLLSDGPHLYQANGDIPAHREGYWEAFRAIDKSIPKIKEYLSKESDAHRRVDLVSSLVLTCSLNDDTAALAEVGTFVLTRFKNDSSQVRLDFLGAINSLFNLSKLEQANWTVINELLQLSSLNNEFSHRSNLLEHLLEKSIVFGMKNSQEVNVQVDHYVKLKTRTYCQGESWCITSPQSDPPHLEKKCLDTFAQKLGQIYPASSPTCSTDSTITSCIISLLESISGYNKRHPKDQLSCKDFPWLMQRLQEILESYNEHNTFRVISALGHDLGTKEALISRLLKTFPLPQVVRYFLNRDPAKLEENAEQIISYILRSNNPMKWLGFLQKLRAQGFPHLCEKCASFCIEAVEDDEQSDSDFRRYERERSCHGIAVMSLLLPVDKFLSFVEKYRPEKPSLEPISDETSLMIYAFRREISKNLKNVSNPAATLANLGHFSQGDYLKLILSSLYSIVNTSPVDKSLPFLQNLLERPAVSAKKHVIRLIMSISSKVDNIKVLQGLWETEKHHTIRQVLFKQIFELFLSNKSPESWELLLSSIKSLTRDDHPFLSELGRTDYFNSGKMPSNKLSEYLTITWEKIESLGDFGPDSKWVKAKLIQCIHQENISSVEELFLENILHKYLFNHRELPNLQSATVQLAVLYLLFYQKASKNKRVETVSQCLKKLISGSWNTCNKDSSTVYPAKQALSHFLEQLCIESFKIGWNVDQKTIFELLQTNLRNMLNPCEMFGDDLFLGFAQIFHSLEIDTEQENPPGPELSSIGIKLGEMVDKLVEKYQGEIVGIVSETLKRFITLCFVHRLIKDGGEGARVIFIIEGVVNSSGSLGSLIVGSHLLLTMDLNLIRDSSISLESKYEDILKQLRGTEHETLKVFVNHRLTHTHPNVRGYDILV